LSNQENVLASYSGCSLTLNLLTWKIRWALNNASRWQMGFNSSFKGLIRVHFPAIRYSCYLHIRSILTIFWHHCNSNIARMIAFSVSNSHYI